MRENSYLGAPSTVMTFLFVRDLALSTDCEKRLKLRHCFLQRWSTYFFVVFVEFPFTVYLEYVKFVYFWSEMIKYHGQVKCKLKIDSTASLDSGWFDRAQQIVVFVSVSKIKNL